MAFLDPVLGWTLLLPTLLAIFVLSLLITLIINLIYKYTTDQKEMKRLKESIDDYRKQIKAAKDNPKKMMKLNNEAMSVNMSYMSKSLKPTLYTFIPIIFIFAWMNGHFTYAPLEQGDPLTIHVYFGDGFSGMATLTAPTLMPSEANSTIQQVDGDNLAAFAVTGSNGVHYAQVGLSNLEVRTNTTIYLGERPKEAEFKGTGPVDRVIVEYPRIRPLGNIHIGSWYPGWLAIYIVLSVLLSISTRKLMKIY